MKKSVNISQRALRYGIVGAVGIIGVLLITSIFLLVRVLTLSGHIADLEAKTTQATKQIASYQRSYCTNTFTVTQSNTVTNHRLKSDGFDRTYRVHTPRNYDPSVRYPVIVSFDGMEGSAARIESYSGVDRLPVIAVYPDALTGTQGFTAWQGAPYAVSGTRDIQFVKDLLATLPSQYCTASTKTFAVGMSNGGGFAMLAGCYISDEIRAVASISGAFYTNCQSAGRTPSLMVVHSKTDKQVPFLGSKPRKLPQLPQWINAKAQSRNCQQKAQNIAKDGTAYYNWYDCKDDSLLRFVVLDNQHHGWLQIPDSAEKKPDTTESIWQFFQDVTYVN